MSDALGCGTYRVLAHDKGDVGQSIDHAFVELRFSTLEWSRVLDDTSEATLLVGAQGCRAPGVSELRTWAHEIAIYRTLGTTATRVWSGPLTGIEPQGGGLTIKARDLSAWLWHRLVHDAQLWVGAELSDIFQAIWEDAILADPVPNFTLSIQPTGVTGDREVLPEQHRIAGDELAELASTGIDWTTIDRVMLAGGKEVPTPAVATLIDQHFAVQMEPSLDGLAQANRVIVQGSGGGAEGDEVVGDSSVVPGPEGLLESVVSQPSILDSGSAGDAADSQVALLSVPQLLVGGSALLPSAPITMDQLIPGARVRIALSNPWTPVSQVLRLGSVRVSVGADLAETVTPEFQPLGSVTP